MVALGCLAWAAVAAAGPSGVWRELLLPSGSSRAQSGAVRPARARPRTGPDAGSLQAAC